MYLHYSLPIIVFLSFSQKFSRSLHSLDLRFILHLACKHACNVLYQPHLYFFYFLVSLSLTARFQNSLKPRIKLHNIGTKCSKIAGVGSGGRGERRENWGESAMAVGG